MNLPVGNYQENVVEVPCPLAMRNYAQLLLNNVAEAGGASESNLGQRRPVELHQIPYALDFRVLVISIKREAMRHL